MYENCGLFPFPQTAHIMLRTTRKTIGLSLALILITPASNHRINFNGIYGIQSQTIQPPIADPVASDSHTSRNEPYHDSSNPDALNGSNAIVQSATRCLGNCVLRHEDDAIYLPFVVLAVCLSCLVLLVIIAIFAI